VVVFLFNSDWFSSSACLL